MGTGMDGKTTAQEIRKYEPYKIIPIVSLSGDELEQDKTIFDEYLQKPITKEGLILTFNRLFGDTTQAKLQ